MLLPKVPSWLSSSPALLTGPLGINSHINFWFQALLPSKLFSDSKQRPKEWKTYPKLHASKCQNHELNLDLWTHRSKLPFTLLYREQWWQADNQAFDTWTSGDIQNANQTGISECLFLSCGLSTSGSLLLLLLQGTKK